MYLTTKSLGKLLINEKKGKKQAKAQGKMSWSCVLWVEVVQ